MAKNGAQTNVKTKQKLFRNTIKMNEVALPCPWGDAIVDFDPLLLTPEQKIWFGMELLSNRARPRELKAKQLSKYRY